MQQFYQNTSSSVTLEDIVFFLSKFVVTAEVNLKKEFSISLSAADLRLTFFANFFGIFDKEESTNSAADFTISDEEESTGNAGDNALRSHCVGETISLLGDTIFEYVTGETPFCFNGVSENSTEENVSLSLCNASGLCSGENSLLLSNDVFEEENGEVKCVNIDSSAVFSIT